VRPSALFVAALGLAAASLGAPAARAHGGGDSVPITLPAFPPGEGQKAQAAIAELEARTAKDPELGRVLAGPLAKAKMALQRAHGARMAGDPLHTRQLEGLALEWTETAAVLVRATAAEKAAQEAARRADEAAARLERIRALLAETQARKERAAAELERVQQESKDGARGAAAAEAQRLEAGKKPVSPQAAPPPPAPAPKKKDKASP
jgi:hypothetical protein